MNLSEKIILEVSGVPLAIIPCVNQILDVFKEKGLAGITHSWEEEIKITPTENFSIEKVLYSHRFTIADHIDELSINGSTSPVFSDMTTACIINSHLFSPDEPNLIENFFANALKEIKALLMHELTHVYENLQRKKHSAELIHATSSSMNANLSSFITENYRLPKPLFDFVFLIYSAAAFEVSARQAQVYPYLEGVTDKSERLKIIKNTYQWNVAQRLSTYTPETYLKEAFDVMPSFQKDRAKELALNGLNYIGVVFANNGVQFLNSFNQDAEILNSVQEKEKANKLLSYNLKKTTSLIKHSPMDFLKYWCKIFNYSGNKAKRKLLKLASQDI